MTETRNHETQSDDTSAAAIPGLTPSSGEDLCAALIGGVHLPLSNAEFAIDAHLMQRGVWLDTDTRILLARLRELMAETASAARRLAGIRAASTTGATRHG